DERIVSRPGYFGAPDGDPVALAIGGDAGLAVVDRAGRAEGDGCGPMLAAVEAPRHQDLETGIRRCAARLPGGDPEALTVGGKAGRVVPDVVVVTDGMRLADRHAEIGAGNGR